MIKKISPGRFPETRLIFFGIIVKASLTFLATKVKILCILLHEDVNEKEHSDTSY